MLNDFFEQLSSFYNTENDLSNITVSLCNSNDYFKELFIHFFFPELSIERIQSIRREVPDKKEQRSRVDILIDVVDEDKPYLIEVKINDRNHHFGQYEQDYEISTDRFGYITNYNCIEGKSLGYDVKRWSEFCRLLSSTQSKDPFITAYLKYLSSVCGIMDISQKLLLDVDSFKDKAIDIFGALTVARTDEYIIRRYCRYQHNEGTKKVDFYYGYDVHSDERPPYYAMLEFNYMNEDIPFIRFIVLKKYNLSAYNILSTPNGGREGHTFDKAMRFQYLSDSNAIGFTLKSQLFNDLDNPESQIALLRDFLSEIILRIKP